MARFIMAFIIYYMCGVAAVEGVHVIIAEKCRSSQTINDDRNRVTLAVAWPAVLATAIAMKDRCK